MSAHEIEDPGARFVRGGAQMTLMLAAVVAENLARARADQRRQARALEAAEARRVEAQLRAEADVARAQLATYVDTGWLEQASPEAIGEAWTNARQWEQIDPEVRPYVDLLRDGVRGRWGVDLTDVESAQEAVDRLDASPLVERQEAVKAPAEQEHEDRSLVDEFVAGGVAGTTGNDVRRDAVEERAQDRDAADETAADLVLVDGVADVVEYDTAARRNALERRAIEAGVDADTAGGRARAAAGQARPAAESTEQQKGGVKGPQKAQQRRSRSSTRGTERGR